LTNDCRTLAAQALCAVIDQGRSLTEALAETLPHARTEDRALLQELCYGVTRHYFRYLTLTRAWLSKPLGKKDTDVHLLLMLGFYQLEAMRIPDYAAVSATVETVRRLNKPWAAGMINALLRRFGREKETLSHYYKSDAERFALPPWLWRQLQVDWPDHWRAIAEESLARAPLTLRRHLGHADASSVLQQIQALDPAACALPHPASGLTLSNVFPVEHIPGFSAGAVSVQDLSAQWAAYLLAPSAGDRVLDLCAAPGGKTCHLLELQPALRELVAVDIDAQRLIRVQENLDRLQLRATLKTADASDVNAWWDGQPFDAILLDAPCSATGVMRRHPDIKLLRRETDVPALVQTQLHLLHAAWSTLKPGGALLYVTCSILRAENDGVVSAFVAQTPDASAEGLPETLGQPTLLGRQILPGERQGDGFYYAKLRKR
jgi:16S rRNA (cytosine967-C5)-methyltransferase